VSELRRPSPVLTAKSRTARGRLCSYLSLQKALISRALSQLARDKPAIVKIPAVLR